MVSMKAYATGNRYLYNCFRVSFWGADSAHFSLMAARIKLTTRIAELVSAVSRNFNRDLELFSSTFLNFVIL